MGLRAYGLLEHALAGDKTKPKALRTHIIIRTVAGER